MANVQGSGIGSKSMKSIKKEKKKFDSLMDSQKSVDKKFGKNSPYRNPKKYTKATPRAK